MKIHCSIYLTLLVAVFGSLSSEGQPTNGEYRGASFREILSVLEDTSVPLAGSIQRDEYAVYQKGGMPQYIMNAKSVFLSGSSALERDAIRTTNERFDYYDHLPKKLHPNGICVTGKWVIHKQTLYSGLLSSGAKGLFVGRISTAMEKTTKDEKRGFGFAGKVFPTMDENEIVPTGNFFTVDVLMGTRAQRVMEVNTTNEPELGFDLSLVGLSLRIASALKKGDENPTFRPLTQIAALGVNSEIKQPKWLRLSPSSAIHKNNESDFRSEIMRALAENKTLSYIISVSDTTKDRNSANGWQAIGEIKIDRAMVSYGCDRRLHFSHPKLK